jgi:hypothetical protein
MMPTNRTPIRQPKRSKIPPDAVIIFRKIQQLPPCLCDLLGTDCRSCETRWQLMGHLHDALGLKPWQEPAIVHPDEVLVTNYLNSAGARWHPQAQQLYRDLERTLKNQKVKI